MAYRFDGVDDVVVFNNAPINGYAAGPVTAAYLFKRNSAGSANHRYGGVDAASSLRRLAAIIDATNKVQLLLGTTACPGTSTFSSTSVWYLLALTWAGGASTPRIHMWNGTAWTHENCTSSPGASLSAWISGDNITVGKVATTFAPADIVCAAIDKANHTDGEIETLSATSFQPWRDFGFDWLVGFETSSAVQDQGAAGTGDETSRTGTSLVSDPAGWTWAAADTTAPTTPTGLGATPVSGTQIDLSWTASTDDVGVTGYKVERKTGAGSYSEVGTPSGTTFSDTGLTEAATYTYRVRATDLAANLSSYSSEVTATTLDVTPPSVPADLAAVADYSTVVDLTWTVSTDAVGVTGYRVERKEGAGAFAEIATPTSPAYHDTGLTANTTYTYRVRAEDDAGNLSGYSSEATVTTAWYPDPAATSWVPIWGPPA